MNNDRLPVALVAALISAVSAFADPDPQLVSAKGAASFHNKDDSVNNNWSGGSTGLDNFFNGRTNDGVYIGPNGRAANGCYVLLEFSKNSSKPMPSGGWYITSIDVSEVALYPYSLYYSTDGSSWTQVPDAGGVSKIGTRSYPVLHVATHVKVVFDEIGGWTASVSEIQVYGLNPSDVSCPSKHAAADLTAWESVQGTATCTEYGIDQRQCTKCGTWFHRESADVLPLDHDYEPVLVRGGTSLVFGEGTNVCSRCKHEIPFPEPSDLTKIAGVAAPGVVQFVNVSASSTGSAMWGISPNNLFDGEWSIAWGHAWFANSSEITEFAQFDFGTEIDLTKIDISVPNRTHTVQFYRVEDVDEELIGELAVTYDSSIPSGDDGYQKFEDIEFRGVTLKTLRIKSDESSNALTICEVHPYGTVKGAGKTMVRTRIIID